MLNFDPEAIPTPEAVAERQRAAELIARHILESLPPGAKMEDVGVQLVQRFDPDKVKEGLLSALTRFEQRCPFRRLDWVTPRKNSDYTGAGEPMLVAQVPETPFVAHQHNAFLVYDMVILRVVQGNIMAYYAEAWQFEHWIAKPKKDEPAAPA